MDKDQLKKLMAKFPCKELSTGNIRTCPVRFSYPNIWEPSKGDEGFKSAFGVTALCPLGADISILREAAKHTAIEKFGPKAGSLGLKMPIRDQAEKDGKAGYTAGAFFFRATSEQQPGVLGPDGRPLTDRKRLYPGVWGLLTVRPFAFDKKQKGVSFGLQNVAILADDESFGGVPADAADEFADVLEGAAATKEIFGGEEVHDFG